MNTTQNKIPVIKTDRLLLRPFALSDAKEVQRMAGNKKVSDTTAIIPYPYPDGAAEEWISKHAEWFDGGQVASWAIVLNAEDKLIGCIDLSITQTQRRGELGYWVGEEFWGNGYCTEAAGAAIEYAFKEKGLHKVTSNHISHNLASGKVMINNGMKKEGVLREHFYKNEKFHDMVVYGILVSEWW